MTKEITQEERLDLTDEKIRAENLAYTIDIFKNFELLAKGMSVKDCKVNCDYIENQRLKEQLDKEIHINRKMKNAINLALSYLASPDRIKEDVPNEELAFQKLRQTLNEINKEE